MTGDDDWMTDFRRSNEGRRQSWFGLKRFVKRAASYPIPHALLRAASRYVPKLRSGRLPAPRELREVVGHVDGASYVMLRPDRCEIAKELYWGDGTRPRPEDANAVSIVTGLARDADVFVDVGAYTGLFTLVTTSVNPSLRAHGFEIVPAVADLFEENVRRNGVADRVTVHREGIGVPGTTMVIPVGEGGSALPSFYSSRMTFEEGVSVGFRSLDSLSDVVGSGDRVVMKIDVEGTEADVLGNGTAFLAAHGTDILCEVLFEKADAAALNAALAPLGYGFLLVRERDLLPVPTIRPHRRYRDWLFTRREAASLRALGLPVA